MLGVGEFIITMFIIFCLFSMANKVWKEHIRQKEHERLMEKISCDLKVEKIETFDDIKEDDLEL